jgi:hypothetical protein
MASSSSFSSETTNSEKNIAFNIHQKTSSTRQQAANAQRAQQHNLFRYREWRGATEVSKPNKEKSEEKGRQVEHYQEQLLVI